jgi:hypothetical protein
MVWRSMKPLPLVSWSRLLATGCTLMLSAGLRADEAPPKPAVPPGVLQRYDKNKDGKLNDTERAKWEADKAQRREKDAARRAELIARFDSNKDGRIDANEGAAAKLAMAQERTEADAVKTKARMEREAAKRKAEEDAATAAKAATPNPAQSADSMSGESMMGDSMMGGGAATPAKESGDKMMMQ